MEIKLLAKGYKENEQLYLDFLNDDVNHNNDYFSNETVYISEAPDFPIYMGKGSKDDNKKAFLTAFQVLSESYLNNERDIIMDETFWHSLLVTYKREYILHKYPQVKNSIKEFKNIVLKKFDWENYIYKCIIAAQYVNDNIFDDEKRQKYYELIIDNLDVFNYIIKYSIFRNDKFLINILDIIDELGISDLAKAKIKDREDLGEDERYGRRVIFELNKSYPVVMAPMLEKDELKEYFLTYLNYYYDVTKIVPENELPVEIIQKNVNEQDNRLEFDYTNIINRKEEAFRTNDFNEAPPITVLEKPRDSSEIDRKNKIDKDKLLEYFKKNNLEYIDKLSNGGCIWVIGDRNIEEYLKPLEKIGITFKFKPLGGRTTRRRPAWFWYEY